jgi:hypothetical protein
VNLQTLSGPATDYTCKKIGHANTQEPHLQLSNVTKIKREGKITHKFCPETELKGDAQWFNIIHLQRHFC